MSFIIHIIFLCRFFILLCSVICISISWTKKPITIMINPAGDAKHTGRNIDSYFERGITLQYFEQCKKDLERAYPRVHVVSTRVAGETVQELQNANFANRLQVDLFLSIHFYQEKKVKSDIFLYYFSYGDDFITKKYDLQFWPYDKAHLIHFDITHQWIHTMKEHLTHKQYQHMFCVQGPFKLPFAPLIGITAPAIGIEIGLKNKNDWLCYVDPIVASLAPIIDILHNT